METFKATECISFGWQTFKKRAWYLIGIFILLEISTVIINRLQFQGGASAFVSALALVVSVLTGIATIFIFLKAHDDVAQVTLADAWNKIDVSLLGRYLGAYILYILIIVVGFILFIIPGIIFMLMFSQTLFLVVDRGLGPIEALKESKRITTGYKVGLFLLNLLSLGVALAGLICIFIGLFAAIPVILLAQMHAYRFMEGRATALSTGAPVNAKPVVG